MKLVGHDDKVLAFQKLMEEGHLGHAYLFFGEAQVGKATFARALARFLETDTFADSASPLIDAKVIVPEEGAIGIDAVRELRAFLSQTPLRSPKRFVLVDDAHLLTAEAQGALLRTMEEPPSHALIVLTAPEPQAILPPLLSRLAKIHFRRLPQSALADFLVAEHKVPAARAKVIAIRSFGRLGRALALLEGNGEHAADLAGEIEERILSLWEKGSATHASAITYLLGRESDVKRYNVNENLMRKAIRSHSS